MTQDDIDNGRLICLIGIAPVKPAEFVIFRIQQKTLEPTDHLATTGASAMPPVHATTRTRITTSSSIVNGVSDDGAAVSGAFTEVSGLEVEINADRVPQRQRGHHRPQDPRAQKYRNIDAASAGSTGDIEFWNWIESALNGDVQRARARSSCTTRTRARSCAGTSPRAGRASTPGRRFNATNNEIAMETLEICVEEPGRWTPDRR